MSRRTWRLKIWVWLLGLLLLLIACEGGNAATSASTGGYTAKSGNAPRSNNAAVMGPELVTYRVVWQSCGGVDGAGAWISGPAWYGDRLVMVYTNMVFAWSLSDLVLGVHPMRLNSPSGPEVETHNPKMTWWNNHNVPHEFENWIRSHGNLRCSGLPVSPLVKRGGQLCQDFENLTLCMPQNGGQVKPLPLGKRFWSANRGNLHTEIHPQGSPDWNVQVVADNQGQSRIHLTVSVLYKTSVAPIGPVLAIWVKKNGARWPFYYKLVPWGGRGAWEESVAVSDLGEGSTRFVVRACVYYNGTWFACGEDSTQVWKP